MRATRNILEDMAAVINIDGLHRGNLSWRGEFNHLTITAHAYARAEHGLPDEFFTNPDAALRLTQCSAGAMTALRALSESLDSNPPELEIVPGLFAPDRIRHVTEWAAATPNTAEVIGRILRAANLLATQTPATFRA
jgi:hypothetical protein